MKYLNAEQIEVTIKRIVTNGKKLDKDIQDAALGCIAHIEANGDVRLFNRLYLAMPKGSRKTALTNWALAFGKVDANAGDNKKEAPFIYSKDKVTKLAEATLNPWYDFAPDKSPDEIVDIMAMLNSLLRKVDKATNVSDAAVASKFREFVGTLATTEEA
jgi:hypothetical protein